jgi:hypothetical protein
LGIEEHLRRGAKRDRWVVTLKSRRSGSTDIVGIGRRSVFTLIVSAHHSRTIIEVAGQEEG